MKYFFIYKKYKYCKLLFLDFSGRVRVYSKENGLIDHIDKFNKVFANEYSLEVANINLESEDLIKVDSVYYLNLKNRILIDRLKNYSGISVLESDLMKGEIKNV